MSIRADQISGFLPKTIISSYISKDECSYWNGYNQALSEISPKELTLNKDKLLNLLDEIELELGSGESFSLKFAIGGQIIQLADALKANEHTLIEVKKDKGEG